MKPQDRMVSQRPDGTWANTRADASRASSLHQTQAAAMQAARAMLRNQGGGEMSVQRSDNNQIRIKDTVSPGNDPRSSRG
jgi:Uncharacterized protein conserved in bacteria (DUF2188)